MTPVDILFPLEKKLLEMLIDLRISYLVLGVRLHKILTSLWKKL